MARRVDPSPSEATRQVCGSARPMGGEAVFEVDWVSGSPACQKHGESRRRMATFSLPGPSNHTGAGLLRRGKPQRASGTGATFRTG